MRLEGASHNGQRRRRAGLWVRAPVRCVFACAVVACVAGLVLAGLGRPATAQRAAPADQSQPSQAAAPRTTIRFLTTDDFPPFNSSDEDGVLTGLNVDLARALCLVLKVQCEITTRPWDDLLPALRRGEADAVIAAHRVTADALRSFAFTDRYFQTPARFAVRRGASAFAATPDGLDGRSVAVLRGSAHEAYMLAHFRDTRLVPFDTPELARQALATGKVDALFDDGIGLVFWVNGTASKACCVLRGGAYFEPKYFGDGIAIVVNKADTQMRQMLNQGLATVRRNGRFLELVDRYFPIRVY
jgi:polar amino acid transport system substrate-binding protein